MCIHRRRIRSKERLSPATRHQMSLKARCTWSQVQRHYRIEEPTLVALIDP
jgi:hypothetical protein